MNKKSSRAVRTSLNQIERSEAYMIPTEIRSYMRSNTFALLYLELHLWRVISKPSTTRGFMPTPLQRAAHVAPSLIIPHQNSRMGKTEIYTGAQSQIQLTCMVLVMVGGDCCFLLDRPPCERFPSLSQSKSETIIYFSILLTWKHFTDSHIVSHKLQVMLRNARLALKAVFLEDNGAFSQNGTSALALSTSHIAAKRGNIPHLIKSAAKEL